jgi:hypothetical protein
MKLHQQLLHLSLTCLALSSYATAQSNQPPETNSRTQLRPGSVVSGRAVFEDTREPATRERVQLIASEYLTHPVQRLLIPTAVTDERGDFEVKGVAAGEYYVVPTPVDEHQRTVDSFPFLHPTGDAANDAAKLAQFKQTHNKLSVDGQNGLTLDLSVWNPHYGRISGHVFDSGGKAATGSSVHLIPQRSGPDMIGQSVATNEEGKYTFYGLAAGEYVIGASPPLQPGDVERSRIDFQGLSEATTYYPSALQAQQSAPVAVIADRETSNIDIRLLARSLHNISGTVRRRVNGQPITVARLHLVKKEPAWDHGNRFPDVSFASVDTKGNWSFSNVPDGTYQVVVEPPTAVPDDRTERFVGSEQTVVVAGADISDVALEVSGGVRIAGVIVIEGADRPVSVSVLASKLPGPGQASVTIRPVLKTNEFVIVGAPEGGIQLSSFTQPSRLFYVKSIEARGHDLLSEQLEALEGDEITDVHIVISSEVSTVSGRVVSASGAPVNDVLVALRPNPVAKRRALGAQPSARTDEKGDFSLTAAPGEYLLQVLRVPVNPQPGGQSQSAVITHDPDAVTLQPGERKGLDIKIP